MKQETLYKKLEKEKEELNKLADEAIKKVSPSHRMRHSWSRTARLTN